MLYQSLRVKGSMVFFLRPFFPFESLLFFPTAMLCYSVLREEEKTEHPSKSALSCSNERKKEKSRFDGGRGAESTKRQSSGVGVD